MKNIIILCLSICYSTILYAQTCKNMVFKTSDEYINRGKINTVEIKSIEYRTWKSSIEAKFKDGEKQLYKVDSIWGYQTDKCVVARWIKEQNTFFYIRESKGIIVYLGEIRQGMKHLPSPSDSRGISSDLGINFFWGRNHAANYYPFFSRTLNSEPMVLNWDNLKEAYKQDDCFMEKVKNIDSFFKEAYALEKSSNKLKINLLYKECHSEIK